MDMHKSIIERVKNRFEYGSVNQSINYSRTVEHVCQRF